MTKNMYSRSGSDPYVTKVAAADLSTARWKQLTRMTSDLVWLADATGEITEVNLAWQAYTGQSIASDLNQSFFEVIHPDERSLARQLWQQAVLTQTLYEIKVRLRNSQGSYVPFLLQTQPLEDKNRVVEWLGIAIQQQVPTKESYQLEALNRQNQELRLRERQAEIAAEAAVTKIRTSTARLTLALDAARMGWWDVDVTTDRAIWNNYHEIIFGYEPGTPERDYFDWERRVHPEDLEQIHLATHQARDNRENLEIQYRIIWPDGSVHWIDAFGRFSYDSEGRPVRMLGVLTDITERKKVESDLRESEEFNRSIVENSADCVKVLDCQGRLISMNDPGKHLMEIEDITPLLGTTWADWWDEPYRSQALEAIEVAKTGKTGRFQGPCSTAKETLKWWDVLVAGVCDSEGALKRLISTSRDITEGKQTELALRESEEKVRLATVAAELGTWFWDLKTNDLVWTDKCKALFGFSPETKMSYELFINCLHPDDRQRTREAVTCALDEKIEYDIEYRSIWPDGNIHWIAAKGRGFYDAEGKAVRMIGMAQDISERKQHESMLQQRSQELESMNNSLFKASTLLAERNQELDRFVHIVSHDLKAPLRGIANLAGWLEDDLSEQLPEENRSQLQLMRQRVDRMDRLISGLLEFARVGRTNVVTEVIDVPELLTEILDSLTIPSTFTVETECQVSTLVARRILLSQVLMNLISNAFKYHDRPDGILCIGVRDLGKHYEFWVQDDGPGIPAEAHTRIFEIFQTLKPSSSTESTGIGLSIVKKIVEVEGGAIHLESAVGVGSTFRFTWPKQNALAVN
jgi:PAS domain S-box-containing protein